MVVKLRFDMGSGFAGCSSTVGCAEAAAVSLLWLLIWLGGSSLILFAKQANIRAAKAVLADERRRVVEEQRAFDRFGERVESVVPTTPPAPEPPGHLLTDGDDSLKKVREAYRETVMAVDHYEEDYGEPLGEHLATEFGDGVATAVIQGDGVPPGLPDALVTRTRAARAVRKNYLGTLDEERQRLEDGQRALADVADSCEDLEDRHLRMLSFAELRERWDRLADHRRRLESILADHQRRVSREVSTGPRVPDPSTFFEYLYADLDVRFPVLADGLELGRELDGLDHRLTRAIAGRP